MYHIYMVLARLGIEFEQAVSSCHICAGGPKFSLSAQFMLFLMPQTLKKVERVYCFCFLCLLFTLNIVYEISQKVFVLGH